MPFHSLVQVPYGACIVQIVLHVVHPPIHRLVQSHQDFTLIAGHRSQAVVHVERSQAFPSFLLLAQGSPVASRRLPDPMATSEAAVSNKPVTAAGDESSESDGETEPAKSFHRRLSTNKNIKSSVITPARSRLTGEWLSPATKPAGHGQPIHRQLIRDYGLADRSSTGTIACGISTRAASHN